MKSRNQRLRRGLALATVVGALAAPTASAMPIDPPGVGGSPSGGYSAYSPNTNRSQPEPARAADGFDWGDAGIGAAGMFAVVAIAAGATVAVGHRPSRGHKVA
jgi:hypothetical protein